MFRVCVRVCMRQRVLGETGSGQVFRAVLASQAASPDCLSFDLVASAMLLEPRTWPILHSLETCLT